MTKITAYDIVNPLPTVKAKHIIVRVFTKVRLIPLGLAIIFLLVGLWFISLILLLVAIGLASAAARGYIKNEIAQIEREANEINNKIDSQNRDIVKASSKLDAINDAALNSFSNLSPKLEEIEQYYDELNRLIDNNIVVSFWETMAEVDTKFDEYHSIMDKISIHGEEFQLAYDDYYKIIDTINKTDEELVERIERYQPRETADAPNFILDEKEFPDAVTPYDNYQKIYDKAMMNTRFQDTYMRWQDNLTQEERHKETVALKREDVQAQQEVAKAGREQARASREQARASREQAQAADRAAQAAGKTAQAASETAKETRRLREIEEDREKRWKR